MSLCIFASNPSRSCDSLATALRSDAATASRTWLTVATSPTVKLVAMSQQRFLLARSARLRHAKSLTGFTSRRLRFCGLGVGKQVLVQPL